MQEIRFSFILTALAFCTLANADPEVKKGTFLDQTLVDRTIQKVSDQVKGFPIKATTGHPVVVVWPHGRSTVVSISEVERSELTPRFVEAIQALGPNPWEIYSYEGRLETVFHVRLEGSQPTWDRGFSSYQIGKFESILRSAGLNPTVGMMRPSSVRVLDSAGKTLPRYADITALQTLTAESHVTPGQLAIVGAGLGMPSLVALISILMILTQAGIKGDVAQRRQRSARMVWVPFSIASVIEVPLLFFLIRLPAFYAVADVFAGGQTALDLLPVLLIGVVPLSVAFVTHHVVSRRVYGPSARDRAYQAYLAENPPVKDPSRKYLPLFLAIPILVLVAVATFLTKDRSIGAILVTLVGFVLVHGFQTMVLHWVMGGARAQKGRDDENLNERSSRLADLLRVKRQKTAVAAGSLSHVDIGVRKSSDGPVVTEKALRDLNSAQLDFLLASYLAGPPRYPVVEIISLLMAIPASMVIELSLPSMLKPLSFLPVLLAVGFIAYRVTAGTRLARSRGDAKALSVTHDLDAAVTAILAESQYAESVAERKAVAKRLASLTDSARKIGIDPIRAESQINSWISAPPAKLVAEVETESVKA